MPRAASSMTFCEGEVSPSLQPRPAAVACATPSAGARQQDSDRSACDGDGHRTIPRNAPGPLRNAALARCLVTIHLQWFAAEDEGRTEEPTEHKIRKAREEGKVAKSQDLNAALILLFTVIALGILARYLLRGMLDLTIYFLSNSGTIDVATDRELPLRLLPLLHSPGVADRGSRLRGSGDEQLHSGRGAVYPQANHPRFHAHRAAHRPLPEAFVRLGRSRLQST